MLVDARGTWMMLQNRRQEPHQFMALKLWAHDVIRSFSLHETHGNKIGLANELHEFGSVLRAKIVFGYKLHELPIGFLRQGSKSRCKAFEHGIGLPEQPFTVSVQPYSVAAPS